MNTRILLVITLATTATALRAAEPAVPLHETGPRQQPAPAGSSDQKLHGASSTLVSPEKARQIVDDFRATVAKDKPRYLIYVNRELVDETSGLRVTGRKERTESSVAETKSSFETDPNSPPPAAAGSGTSGTQVNVNIGNTTTDGGNSTPGKGNQEGRGTKVTAENTYTYSPRTTGTLVDRQTVRDIERLFGRPLRAGGARLADQRTASSLIADKPLDHFTTATNETARKDREALIKITDVVVEILVSSRNIKVAQVSGDTYESVPDIQATAIRLSDSAIIGQASATDVLGKDKDAGRIVRKFDVRDIAEATALALMEDITLTTE